MLDIQNPLMALSNAINWKILYGVIFYRKDKQFNMQSLRNLFYNIPILH